MKVLVVDDEVKLADVVGELLRRNKFVVDVVYNGDDGFFYAKNGDYDRAKRIMEPLMQSPEAVRLVDEINRK